MKKDRAILRLHRRSRAEVTRLVGEFERSGMGRKEFCAAYGLSVHTLDAWRRRVARSGVEDRIVPVELVENRDPGCSLRREGVSMPGRQLRGLLRVVLGCGFRIEIEPGFDAMELRRLIAALEAMALPGRRAVSGA